MSVVATLRGALLGPLILVVRGAIVVLAATAILIPVVVEFSIRFMADITVTASAVTKVLISSANVSSVATTSTT